MRYVIIAARLLLGLMFVIFGSNLVLLFLPPPPRIPGNAGAFSSAMFTSHFVYLVSAAQVIPGALLIVNQYVPLALVVLAAVIVNIWAFHITMWPQAIVPFPILVTICWFIVAWPLRAHFAPLLARKVEV